MPTLEKEAQAVQLFVDQSEDGQVDSTVPLRWCISKETAERLQFEEVEDPHLLIVISNDGEEVGRYLVPLTSEMRYIQFRRPGTNIVHAGIVRYRTSIMDRKNGRFENQVLEQCVPGLDELNEEWQKLISDANATAERLDALKRKIDAKQKEPAEPRIWSQGYHSVSLIGDESQLSVVVPEAMFAKESKLLGFFGRLYFDRDARDQCHLRRRAMATVVTLPVVAPVLLAFLIGFELVRIVIVAGLLLLGMRGINFSALNPLSIDTPDRIWERGLEPPVWFFRKTGQVDHRDNAVYEFRSIFFWLVNPITIVGFTALTIFLGDVASVVRALLYAIGVLVAAGIVLVLIERFAAQPVSRLAKRTAKKHHEIMADADRLSREKLYRDLEQLACDNRPRTASLDALPKERRSVTLRYQAFKAKVCKPFAA